MLSLAAALLGGCAAPGPTENPLDTPEEDPPVVSVCYAPLVTELVSEVEPVARDACTEAGTPNAALRYWKTSHMLNDCPLFKKSRISYFCLPPAAYGGGGALGTGAPADADSGDDEAGAAD